MTTANTLAQALTDRERRAADHYILYGVKSDAYRHAYNTENMKDDTVHRETAVVFGRPRVQMYILERQRGQAKEFDMQVYEIKKLLATVAARCLKDRTDREGNVVPIDPKAVVQALSEINRMNGNHAPTQSQVMVAQVAASDLTVEEYRQIRRDVIEHDDC